MADAISAFVRSRLDEQEAAAQYGHDALGCSPNCGHVCDQRRVEIKRLILAEHAPADYTAYGDELCRRCIWTSDEVMAGNLDVHWVTHPCRTLRLLASEWSAHDDYRQEWTP